jgi:hypothetical protein
MLVGEGAVVWGIEAVACVMFRQAAPLPRLVHIPGFENHNETPRWNCDACHQHWMCRRKKGLGLEEEKDTSAAAAAAAVAVVAAASALRL